MDHIEHLFHQLAAELSQAKTDDQIDAFATRLHQFLDQIERTLVGDTHTEARGGAQSKQFMLQLLPTIQTYMRHFSNGHKFEILDIGPGVGTGSNLLGSLYQTNRLGYRATVATLDIRPFYFNYMKVFCRYVQPAIMDLFDLDRSFDIVIASHVIEHVPDPLAFVRRMQQTSRGIVVLCAPYREQSDMLTNGHVNIFDDDFLGSLDAESVKLVESPAWGQFLDPPYKMFIAVLPGVSRPNGVIPHE